MDVILLKAIEKLGAEGDVVRVKPGFARNYLLPGGLAVPASPQQLKAVEAASQRRLKQAGRVQAEAETLKRRLEGLSLTLKLTLGENEQPFGSITAHDVAEALGREGLPVDKGAIRLETPIKALGVFEVPVRLHPNVAATLKLWVVKA
ncbi:MAG: 50S ribosomal protein L9 [Candidatus Omnitrophica bacterium]|nr:50S ribosomal protein L9 [Candidatus Omnitrophota bacterium]